MLLFLLVSLFGARFTAGECSFTPEENEYIGCSFDIYIEAPFFDGGETAGYISYCNFTNIADCAFLDGNRNLLVEYSVYFINF
jgi:hypothetical protein